MSVVSRKNGFAYKRWHLFYFKYCSQKQKFRGDEGNLILNICGKALNPYAKKEL
jgi:hypothetical protein